MTCNEHDHASGPPADKGFGLKAFLWDVRHRRWRFRQYMNALFFTLLMILGCYAPPQILWGIVAGACMAVVGISVRLWASGCVKKNEELAMDGPYAFVRHPLYVGNFLIGTGFSLASGHFWVLPVWWLLYYVYHAPAIEREDRKLRNRFPDSWQAWAETTPALLPVALLKLQKCPHIGPWSLRQSLRNGEPLYAFVLLCGLAYLSRLFV